MTFVFGDREGLKESHRPFVSRFFALFLLINLILSFGFNNLEPFNLLFEARLDRKIRKNLAVFKE